MSTNMTISVEAPAAAPNCSRIASPIHTLLVLAAQAGLGYRAMHRLGQIHGSIDRIQLYERTILFQLLMLAVVLVGVRLHGSPLATVLGGRWRSLVDVLRDAGIGVAFFFVSMTALAVIHGHGGGSDQTVQFLLPRGRLETGLWIAVSMTAGICEEAIYRGYLQRQFVALTKNVPLGITLSASVFSMSHAYQGLTRAIEILLLGAMSGILAHWRKSVRPGMFAHAIQDILGGLLGGRVGH